jgi:uncharacterized OsmC-like protein
LRLSRDYQFTAAFDDVAQAAPILVDEPQPLGEARGPNAADLLGAAVGNCLSASLAFCLRKARVELVDLTAHVTVQIERNEQGRHRITGIDVDLVPKLGSMDGARAERCEALFEDFCTVTASIRKGIPVRVTLEDGSACATSVEHA